MSSLEISAVSLSPYVNVWLANSLRPRILHVFDRVCNLVNERRDVLSIVARQIGDGPFNLVVENDILFSEYCHIESPISIHDHQLILGDLLINRVNAKLWPPRPDWALLRTHIVNILDQVTSLSVTNYEPSLPAYLRSNLTTSIIAADTLPCLAAIKKLAGLGNGLTPAGDDFILGSLYAAWIIHPPETSRVLAEEIANTATPLTTSLSSAWLRSAGRGEAGVLWHDFFDALVSADARRSQEGITRIAAVGETSGADALAGFISTLVSYQEYTTTS